MLARHSAAFAYFRISTKCFDLTNIKLRINFQVRLNAYLVFYDRIAFLVIYVL